MRTSRATSPAGCLRLARQRRDDRADDVDVVAVGVVAERVVVGDELALGCGDAPHAGGDRAIERAQPREVAVGVGGVRRAAGGVGGDQRVADALPRRSRRCAGPATSAGRCRRLARARSQLVEDRERAGVRAGVGAARRRASVEIAARAHDDLRARHGAHVARPRLVGMRVGAAGRGSGGRRRAAPATARARSPSCVVVATSVTVAGRSVSAPSREAATRAARRETASGLRREARERASRIFSYMPAAQGARRPRPRGVSARAPRPGCAAGVVRRAVRSAPSARSPRRRRPRRPPSPSRGGRGSAPARSPATPSGAPRRRP